MNRTHLFAVLLVLLTILTAGCAAAEATPTPAPIVINASVSPTPVPTQILEPPSPTPFLPSFTRVTNPGCCIEPFWSADGQQVLFIDKPSEDAATAIYGVSAQGGGVQVFSEQVGLPSQDWKYLAFLNKREQTTVREVASGTEWVIPADGQRVFFSPGDKRLAWSNTADVGNFDERRADILISDIDGQNPQSILTLYGGGIAGWLDDERLVVVGKQKLSETGTPVFWINISTGETSVLAQEVRIRNVSIAPGGEWVLYTVALDATNSDNDGLWVTKSDSSQRFKLAVVGSARWRDATHLLIVPFEPGVNSHRLWQFDALTGQAQAITDPIQVTFRISAGNWSVSPTGDNIVFLNAEDRALWVMSLPPLSP